MKRRYGTARAGFLLPIAACVLVLIMMSVLLVSRFGSDTRLAFIRQEAAIHCNNAALSAIAEARERVRRELEEPVNSWKPWWQSLRPQSALGAENPLKLEPTMARKTYLTRKIDVKDVSIVCLHKSVSRGRAQGLLSFSVEVFWKSKDEKTLQLRYEERVRFMVWRRPGRGERLVLFPGRECSRVERQI